MPVSAISGLCKTVSKHNGKLRSLAAVADLITVEDRLVFARLRQAEAIVRPGDRAEVADHDQLAAAAIDAAFTCPVALPRVPKWLWIYVRITTCSALSWFTP